jgi:hypothetical protein
MLTASLSAPASGARASRIVLGASGRPFFVPPLFANRRCHTTTESGVTSRIFIGPSSGRT